MFHFIIYILYLHVVVIKIMLAGYYKKGLIEAGCDEAGRGCLAGPVYAAAVILPFDYHHSLLTDSKKLSHKQRELLREEIIKEAVDWAVQPVDHEIIDKINILNASILAMHNALKSLKTKPEHIIVDGNRFKKFSNIPHVCIVKGDSKYFSIAAASVLAKTFRDDYMMEMHEKYPVYGWDHNKGYATQLHRDSIQKNGQSPIHRKSFKLFETQLSINFS